MKANRFVSAVLGVGLIAGSSVALAGAMVPNKTIFMQFVGYCDGVSVKINQSTGRVTGTQTGCHEGGIVDGMAGSISGGPQAGQGVVVTFDDSEGYGNYVVVFSDTPRTWTMYRISDHGIQNSGTWEVGSFSARVDGAPAAGD